eukprot:5579146-Amphidinium_carterae.2
MLQGQGVVVTDCKGAAVVANKLKAGLRRARGQAVRDAWHHAPVLLAEHFQKGSSSCPSFLEPLSGRMFAASQKPGGP